MFERKQQARALEATRSVDAVFSRRSAIDHGRAWQQIPLFLTTNLL